MALSPEEQQRAARTQKARTFLVFRRTIRPAWLDADFQQPRAQSESPAPGGPAPVDAGVVARATRLQASGQVSAQDAVELTGMATRWQRGWDGLDAEHPPCRRGPLFHVRLRRIAHHLDKPLLDRTVAVAAQTGGGGARPRRAALDSPPLVGAGRVADPLTRLGHALRTAGGLAAKAVETSAEGLLADAGLELVGQSSLPAALERAWGAPTARASARRLVLEEGERGQNWLEQPQRLAVQEPPLPAVLETIEQRLAQATEPDLEGGPGARRLKPHVAPDRRSAMEDADMRHGRTRSATTCNGFTAHRALAWDSHGTRAVVGCPANHPAQEAVELLAEAVAKGAGLFPVDSDLGARASPRMAPWAAQGGPILARPWPPRGPRVTQDDCPLDFPHGTVTWPNGQTVPLVPGPAAPFPARACDVCPVRAPCTTARLGPGRRLTIREDEPVQQQLRATIKTKRGRASLRTRTAVAPAMAPHGAHRGRRAR